MGLKTFKDGVLVPCSVEEFTAALRRLAEWSDQQFCVMSDPSALIGFQLHAAADLIDELAVRGDR